MFAGLTVTGWWCHVCCCFDSDWMVVPWLLVYRYLVGGYYIPYTSIGDYSSCKGTPLLSNSELYLTVEDHSDSGVTVEDH